MKELASSRTENDAAVAALPDEITYQGRGVVLFADLSGYTDLTTKLSDLASTKIGEGGAIDRRPADYLVRRNKVTKLKLRELIILILEGEGDVDIHGTL